MVRDVNVCAHRDRHAWHTLVSTSWRSSVTSLASGSSSDRRAGIWMNSPANMMISPTLLRAGRVKTMSKGKRGAAKVTHVELSEFLVSVRKPNAASVCCSTAPLYCCWRRMYCTTQHRGNTIPTPTKKKSKTIQYFADAMPRHSQHTNNPRQDKGGSRPFLEKERGQSHAHAHA